MKLKLLYITLAVITFSLGFTSCSDDEDDTLVSKICPLDENGKKGDHNIVVLLDSTCAAIDGIKYQICDDHMEITGQRILTINSNTNIWPQVRFDGKVYTVTKIRKNALRGISQITSIPNTITEIGPSAFWYCDGIQELFIPSGVTRIEGEAFEKCCNMKTLVLHSNVNFIANWAFNECTALTDVYCYATSVPEVEIEPFWDSNYQNATLHVPAESLEQYKQTEIWKNFGAIVALKDTDPKQMK